MADVESALEVPLGIAEGKGDEDVEMSLLKDGSCSMEDSIPIPITIPEDELTADCGGDSLDLMAQAVADQKPETQLVETSVSTEVTSESNVINEPKEELDEVKSKDVVGDMRTVIEAEITKTIPSAEEIEDDIIVLDDEESGVKESKRPRKDEEDEIMEVDENGVMTKEERESVGNVIRKMSRSDLEDLVLAKIVEAVVAHTEVGQLRGKVLELQLVRDKMAGKMGVMMKQVAELSSAVNIIMENESRDPKNRIGKPHVIRFNRSVGLQTSIEPSVRSAPPKIIRVPDASQNGVKQYGSSAGKQSVFSGTNGTFNPPQSHPVKRIYTPSKPGDNKLGVGQSQTATIQPSPRKTYSSVATPQRIHPIAPKPMVSQQHSVTVTPISQNVQPLVDLTDDDPPAASPAPQASTATPPGSTTFINGVQYQIVNTARPVAPGGVQIVSPGAQTQQKYIVTPSQGQNRPVLLQQVAVGSSSGSQQFILRGVNNSAPVVLQRPVAPRPSANGSLPRVAATIPVRSAPGGGVLGATSNTPRKFILPPLPTTPIAKQKNDMFRPPPKPELTLNEQTDGIVLSWNLPTVNNMAEVTTYQIFACQESLTTSTNRPSQWKRVGDVKALPLPMACTLSQFTEENRYYFIVRGIDVYGRVGPFCDPQNILLRRKK